jgi:hypothetical protein
MSPECSLNDPCTFTERSLRAFLKVLDSSESDGTSAASPSVSEAEEGYEAEEGLTFRRQKQRSLPTTRKRGGNNGEGWGINNLSAADLTFKRESVVRNY